MVKTNLKQKKLKHLFVDGAFTPEEFMAGHKERYVNRPILPPKMTIVDIELAVAKAMDRPMNKPFGLLHQSHPPGHDSIMGLAAWPSAMDIFQKLVGSLRTSGFDGHIILGVHEHLPFEEKKYLIKMDVTFYAVPFVKCNDSIATGGGGSGVRGYCSKSHEDLKLEWGRFEMALEWLHACEQCTGWTLVCDTRDLFFQANPFANLPSPPNTSPYELMFIEEISKHTCPKKNDPKRYYVLGTSFYQGRKGDCYGEYHLDFMDRPVLCSGTIIGNRHGMERFLAVYVDEFHANNRKKKSEMQISPFDRSVDFKCNVLLGQIWRV